MATRILIIQGHPDPAGGHLDHALAESYAVGARAGGHTVETLDLAEMDIPFLRNAADFADPAPTEALRAAQEQIAAAGHLVIVFPLWLGDMPALVKAFLEQVMRPGFALAYPQKGFPKPLLAGRSARLIVTMGMPAPAYRWIYGAHAVRALERNILRFVGIKPVRRTLIGGIGDLPEARSTKLMARMREMGAGAR